MKCSLLLRFRYSWTKNGKPYDWQVYDDRISQQPGRGTLVITSPRNEDIGTKLHCQTHTGNDIYYYILHSLLILVTGIAMEAVYKLICVTLEKCSTSALHFDILACHFSGKWAEIPLENWYFGFMHWLSWSFHSSLFRIYFWLLHFLCYLCWCWECILQFSFIFPFIMYTTVVAALHFRLILYMCQSCDFTISSFIFLY